MDLTYRDLTLADIPALGWSGSSLHLEYIANRVNLSSAGDVETVAALADGEIVAKGEIDYKRYPGFATIAMVNVKDELQGKGIGTSFFQELERRSITRGVLKARLHVERTNERAVQLYLKLGYKVTGEIVETWEQFDLAGNIETYTAICDVMKKDL